MKTTKNGFWLALALLLSSVYAADSVAVLIDFEDGTSETSIDDFYSDQGVVFSNAEWITQSLTGMSGTIGVRAPGTYQFFQDNAVVATFPGGVGSVSMLGVDVGANGLRMDAYDAEVGGNLIDFDEAFGTAAGIDQFFTVQTEAAAIMRIELYQIAINVGGEGIILDDLEFDAEPLVEVPVPTLSTWALILLGLLLASVAYVGLRRQRTF